MNYSYITPRPQHYKQDKIKAEEFKKLMSMEVANCKFKRILFLDESRFGTHSKIGCGWFERGKRTAIKVKINYTNFFLYSAVDIKDGSNFTLILPHVNTESMNVFLSELSKRYNAEEVMLVMDGAGWHKSKTLKVPDNITITYLPPYSPELNPVERLWLYIKNKVVVNKLYESIDALEAALCTFINNLTNELVKSICNCNYLGT